MKVEFELPLHMLPSLGKKLVLLLAVAGLGAAMAFSVLPAIYIFQGDYKSAGLSDEVGQNLPLRYTIGAACSIAALVILIVGLALLRKVFTV